VSELPAIHRVNQSPPTLALTPPPHCPSIPWEQRVRGGSGRKALAWLPNEQGACVQPLRVIVVVVCCARGLGVK